MATKGYVSGYMLVRKDGEPATLECEACEGEGRKKCAECSGRGNLTCPMCGTEDVGCKACSGNGDSRCGACRGSGDVLMTPEDIPRGKEDEYTRVWTYPTARAKNQTSMMKDATQFRASMDAITNLIDDGELRIGKDGLSLRAMDGSGISMLEFSMPRACPPEAEVELSLGSGEALMMKYGIGETRATYYLAPFIQDD